MLDFKVFHIFLYFIWFYTFVFTLCRITFINSKLPEMLIKTFFDVVGMQNLSLIMIWTNHLVIVFMKKVILGFRISILSKVFFSITNHSINEFLQDRFISFQIVVPPLNVLKVYMFLHLIHVNTCFTRLLTNNVKLSHHLLLLII